VSGNSFAPTSGPGDTLNFYPLAGGNQWQYNFTTNDPKAVAPSAVVTLTVTGTKLVLGATASVVNRADPTSASGGFDSYLSVSPGGVTDLGNTDATDPLTPQLVPYTEQLFPVQVGTVSTVIASNLPDGTDGGGHAVTLDLTQTIANSAFESIDVPAGTFTGALKQTTVISGTVHDNGQAAPITGTDTSWYVPGVGPVRDLSSATGGGTTLNSDAQLRFFVVNGAPHGLGPAVTLGTSDTGGVPVSPVITTDGTNFLIVTQQFTNSGTPQQYLQGILVDPYGNKQVFNITAPGASPGSGTPQLTVAGFDGTNYLVVHETDHTATSQPKTLDALVVSPTGAILAGPNTVATVGPYNPGTNAEALAFDGTHYLLIYISNVGQLSGVFITPATGQATGASFAIVSSSGPAVSPAIAFDGTNYLLAWNEVTSGPDVPGLKAVRVSAAGVVLDTTPLLIAQVSFQIAGSPMTPTVTFDGTNYLVTYRDYRNEGGDAFNARVSAARVSKALTLLDGSATSPSIHVTSTPSVPLGQISAVYMQGTHWLVWEAAQALYGSRVSPAGTVPAAWIDGFPLAPATTGASYPVITASGPGSGGYATWLQGSGGSSALTLSGMRIYSSGP
jgi:hypothetical protein